MRLVGNLVSVQRLTTRWLGNNFKVSNQTNPQSVKLGKPSKMNDGLKSAIQLLRQKGMGIKQIAKECGVGIGTVYSVI